MNPRIRELAEQAGITTNLDTDFFDKDPNKWVDYYSEKFAELIVEEMYDFIMEESANDNGIPDLGKIKQHFGVEQ